MINATGIICAQDDASQTLDLFPAYWGKSHPVVRRSLVSHYYLIHTDGIKPCLYVYTIILLTKCQAESLE